MSRNNSFIPLLLCLIFVTQTQVYAQSEKVITLPNVEVDTLSYPALRILKQLQAHEKEDRLASIQSFDVHTEGDYVWEFKASKFMRSYLRGTMSVFGWPRLSKILLDNELVTHKIHAHQQFNKGKMKDVDVKLDSANIDLTQKQYKLLKRSNFNIDDYILAQFRSPKHPWGSKRYQRYEWLLTDTLNIDGHRVDVLQFSSKPSKSTSARMRGGEIGKIWIIEDYWRIIGVERQNLKNQSMMKTHLEQIAPGVFLPSEMTYIEHINMDINSMLDVLKINPDSLNEKQRKKLDKKIFKIGDTSICEGYNLSIKYDNVKHFQVQ